LIFSNQVVEALNLSARDSGVEMKKQGTAGDNMTRCRAQAARDRRPHRRDGSLRRPFFGRAIRSRCSRQVES